MWVEEVKTCTLYHELIAFTWIEELSIVCGFSKPMHYTLLWFKSLMHVLGFKKLMLALGLGCLFFFYLGSIP